MELQFRLSDNCRWATEFLADASTMERQLCEAMRQSAGRVVSLHVHDGRAWCNIGNREMGVFYDGKSGVEHGGRWERHGYGLEFLSISPAHPMAETVWAMASELWNAFGRRSDEPELKHAGYAIRDVVDCRPVRTPQQARLNELMLEMCRIAPTTQRMRDPYRGEQTQRLAAHAREYATTVREHFPNTDWAAWEEHSRRIAPTEVVERILAAR